MNSFSISKRLFLPLVLLLIAGLVVPAVFAQETTGGVQGYVKDTTGAVIAKATVTITSPALLEPKVTETDSGGYYRFAQLPPGTYTLQVHSTNFRDFKQTGIGISVGRLPTIDVVMVVGATSETVEVTGAAPLVDPTTRKAAINIPEQTIHDLPKTRQFYSLINFAPGARQEPLQSNSRGGTGFQIDGASDGENTYLI